LSVGVLVHDWAGFASSGRCLAKRCVARQRFAATQRVVLLPSDGEWGGRPWAVLPSGPAVFGEVIAYSRNR